ncbi:MAG: PD-(D/E)XK nuclease family protein, partial [Burkholderiales bacterium]|nr:PD-(D/E)XK nuclease family protein [Burkholderiales bacterium]
MGPDILAALSRGATLVTPTRRLARDLKRRFDLAQLSDGRVVWGSADILPASAWLARLWEALTRSTSAPRLLSVGEELVLWQRAVADSRYAHPLLDTQAAARAARDAYGVAVAWRLDGTDIPDLHADARAFQDWRQRFETVCRVQDRIAPAALADAVATRLPGLPAAAPVHLLVYGFDQPTPQVTGLLQTLSAAGTEVRVLGPDGPVGSCGVRSYPSVRSELEGIAVAVREHLASHPQMRIGVVVPDLGQRRAEVLRVFDDVLEPTRVLRPGTAGGRPFNVSAGAPLSEHPLIATALRILRFGQHGSLPLTECGALLRSPFIGEAEREASRRALLDARLRDRGAPQVAFGTLRFEAFAEDRTRPHACRALGARLDEWQRRLEPVRSRHQLPSAWSGAVQHLLAAFGWPGEQTLDSVHFQTVQKWRETVAGLSALDGVLGAVDFSVALMWLSRLAADTLFQPESGDVPVQIVGLLEAVGLEFDVLFVTGLHDDVFPAPARPNPLLPLALQRARGVPRSSAEWEAGFARRTLDLLRRAASIVEFSCARQDADRELRPSPLLASISSAAEAESSDRFDTHATRVRATALLETVTDSHGPPLSVGHETGGGARIFEDQAACPFRAFARHRLGAEGLEEAHAGLDARDRGTLLHAALADLWHRFGDHATLVQADADVRGQVVATAVATALDAFARRHADVLPPGLRRLEAERMSRLLLRLLEVEAARAPFRVVEREAPRSIEIGGLRVRARLDRVDELEDGGRAILDYKTGRATASRWVGERPEEPQLPLYAIAEGEAVTALVFAVLRPEQVVFRGVSDGPDVFPGVAERERSSEFDEYPS